MARDSGPEMLFLFENGVFGPLLSFMWLGFLGLLLHTVIPWSHLFGVLP